MVVILFLCVINKNQLFFLEKESLKVGTVKKTPKLSVVLKVSLDTPHPPAPHSGTKMNMKKKLYSSQTLPNYLQPSRELVHHQ